MAIDLLTPVLTGIKNINYFEGRLLTARDLREQEQANRALRWDLGRAIGSGIINGLRVVESGDSTGTAVPVVEVSVGTAINAKGQILEIAGDSIKVALSKSDPKVESVDSIFTACAGPPDSKQIPNGTGIYLLTISPTSMYQEFAPKSGLLSEGNNPDCGRRYVAEGIQFRLVEIGSVLFENVSADIKPLINSLLLSSNPASEAEPLRLSKLQNIFAHLCYDSDYYRGGGIDVIDNEGGNIWDFNQGILSELLATQNGLTDCDVPLSALYWTDDGIAFLDNWSVRRLLPDLNMPRRLFRSLVAVSMQQFQEQLAAFKGLETIKLADNFQYIPPLGHIPLSNSNYNSASGFKLNNFFGNRMSQLPSIINASQVPALVDLAASYPPVQLAEVAEVNVYYVRENIEALLRGDETQFFAYFSLPEIGYRFCSPPTFIDNNLTLHKDNFLSLFEAGYQVYRGFENLVVDYLIQQELEPNGQVIAGFQAIDQVLVTLEGVTAILRSGCLSNHGLYKNFQRMADQQRNFVTVWRSILTTDSVSTNTRRVKTTTGRVKSAIEFATTGNNESQFIAAVKKVIDTVTSLIEDPDFEGFRGLLVALADHDLVSASLTQQKINQSFTINLGTGATGIIGLNYVNPPVIPPEQVGAAGGNILRAGEYVFGFELDARITAPSRIRIKPRIEQFGWDAVLIDDENVVLHEPHFLNLEKSDHLPNPDIHLLKVKVTVPDSGEPAAALILQAEEDPSGGGIPQAQATISLTRDGSIPIPDNRVVLKFNSYGEPPNNATPFGGGIAIPGFSGTSIAFAAVSEIKGQFVISINAADGSPWQLLKISGAQPETPGELEFEFSGAPMVEAIGLSMFPGETAGGDTDLVLRLRSRPGSVPAVEPPFEEIYRLPVYIQG